MDPKRIRHTKAFKIHSEGGLEVSQINQKNLTGDCWLVQFNGFKACSDCPEYLNINCGGGVTLANMILDLGESIMSRWHTQQYFFNLDLINKRVTSQKENTSFYELVQLADKEGFLQFGLRKYKREIKQFQLAKEDPQAERLDSLYPYSKISEEGELISRESWHNRQHCNCRALTRSGGAYRDELYNYNAKVIVYYHQHCVVVKEGSHLLLDSCDYRTPTTKLRINNHLPYPYYLYQKKYRWFIANQSTGEQINFFDGMTL